MQITDIDTHFGVDPGSDLDLSLGNLVSILRRHGIRQALTHALSGIQFDHATGNDDTWAACQAHPELFPIATVDPRRFVGMEAEIARRAEQGFVGYRFYPQRQGWAVDGQLCRRLLQAVAQTGKPAIISVAGAGDPTRLLRAAEGLELPLVLSGTSYGTVGEALAVLQEAPNFHLQMHMVALPFQVEEMAAAVGAARLLFGSLTPAHYTRPTWAMIEASELSDADKALILGGNARRIFNLPDPEAHP